jgi:hypothetical protein
MATINGVTGNQYTPNTNGYENAKYQYATSSYATEHRMEPELIVHPTSKNDIALTLKYAKAQKIAVAIRTGGHQYSGASSTAAPNMQLDLGGTFRAPDDRRIFEANKQTFVRTSVSWSFGRIQQLSRTAPTLRSTRAVCQCTSRWTCPDGRVWAAGGQLRPFRRPRRVARDRGSRGEHQRRDDGQRQRAVQRHSWRQPRKLGRDHAFYDQGVS